MSRELPATPRFKSVLFKLSGELLGGDNGVGLDANILNRVAGELMKLPAAGIRTAVVVGGGNFFRGARNQSLSMSTVRGHQMGMLFTVANAIALEQALWNQGAKATVQSAIAVPAVVAQFDGISFAQCLNRGEIVIFAGGTGCTHFTTDTAASLRAIEMNADILLKATDVDGVYDKDPATDSNAKRYDTLTFDRVLADNLTVMDASSIALCRDHRLPVCVFNGAQSGNIIGAGYGAHNIGTQIHL